MKEATDEAREQGLATLHPLEVEDWQAQFVALVAHADATAPTAQAPPGTKGRAKQSAARNLLDRLIGDQEAVLAFVYRLVVPFDNDVIAYCTPSACLACLLKLTFILVMRVFACRWELHDPTSISA